MFCFSRANSRKHEFEKGFELKNSRGWERILDSYADPRLRLGFA